MVETIRTGTFDPVYAPPFLKECYTLAVPGTNNLLTFDVPIDNELQFLSLPHADIVALWFACDDRVGFADIEGRFLPQIRQERSDIPIVLVCSKIDLRSDDSVSKALKEKNETIVQFEEGLALSKSIGAVEYVEVSTAHNIGLSQLMEVLYRFGCETPLRSPKESRCVVS